jgi:hypothetical protein
MHVPKPRYPVNNNARTPLLLLLIFHSQMTYARLDCPSIQLAGLSTFADRSDEAIESDTGRYLGCFILALVGSLSLARNCLGVQLRGHSECGRTQKVRARTQGSRGRRKLNSFLNLHTLLLLTYNPCWVNNNKNTLRSHYYCLFLTRLRSRLSLPLHSPRPLNIAIELFTFFPAPHIAQHHSQCDSPSCHKHTPTKGKLTLSIPSTIACGRTQP